MRGAASATASYNMASPALGTAVHAAFKQPSSAFPTAQTLYDLAPHGSNSDGFLEAGLKGPSWLPFRRFDTGPLPVQPDGFLHAVVAALFHWEGSSTCSVICSELSSYADDSGLPRTPPRTPAAGLLPYSQLLKRRQWRKAARPCIPPLLTIVWYQAMLSAAGTGVHRRDDMLRQDLLQSVLRDQQYRAHARSGPPAGTSSGAAQAVAAIDYTQLPKTGRKRSRPGPVGLDIAEVATVLLDSMGWRQTVSLGAGIVRTQLSAPPDDPALRSALLDPEQASVHKLQDWLGWQDRYPSLTELGNAADLTWTATLDSPVSNSHAHTPKLGLCEAWARMKPARAPEASRLVESDPVQPEGQVSPVPCSTSNGNDVATTGLDQRDFMQLLKSESVELSEHLSECAAWLPCASSTLADDVADQAIHCSGGLVVPESGVLSSYDLALLRHQTAKVAIVVALVLRLLYEQGLMPILRQNAGAQHWRLVAIVFAEREASPAQRNFETALRAAVEAISGTLFPETLAEWVKEAARASWVAGARTAARNGANQLLLADGMAKAGYLREPTHWQAWYCTARMLQTCAHVLSASFGPCVVQQLGAALCEELQMAEHELVELLDDRTRAVSQAVHAHVHIQVIAVHTDVVVQSCSSSAARAACLQGWSSLDDTVTGLQAQDEAASLLAECQWELVAAVLHNPNPAGVQAPCQSCTIVRRPLETLVPESMQLYDCHASSTWWALQTMGETPWMTGSDASRDQAAGCGRLSTAAARRSGRQRRGSALPPDEPESTWVRLSSSPVDAACSPRVAPTDALFHQWHRLSTDWAGITSPTPGSPNPSTPPVAKLQRREQLAQRVRAQVLRYAELLVWAKVGPVAAARTGLSAEARSRAEHVPDA